MESCLQRAPEFRDPSAKGASQPSKFSKLKGRRGGVGRGGGEGLKASKPSKVRTKASKASASASKGEDEGGFEGFEGEDEGGFEGLEGERRGSPESHFSEFRRMRSKNEIKKQNKIRGGWSLEEVPSLSSSKKKLQAFEGQEIEGVEFRTILHSSLLQASKDNKKLRGGI